MLSGPLGRLIGGRIWRYQLDEAVGTTRVTETWDISKDKQAFFLKRGKLGEQTADAMAKTLERLADITER